MGRIFQKGAPRGHRFDVLQVPLAVQLQLDVALLGDQLYQIFRLMDVELIDHKDPSGSIGVGSDGPLDVRGKVLVGAGWTYRGSDHPAGCHLEVSNQTLRAVADVFVLLAFEP